MNSIAITKPASKPKWVEVSIKYNWKKLSKQRKLTKRSGRSWKADQLFQVKGCKKRFGMRFHVAFVKEMWTLWKMCHRENGLGSSWIIQCQNESCPSQSTNSAFTTTEKGKGFEVNRATILGLRSTSCGHAAASTFLSFIGLTPISMLFLGSSTGLCHLYWNGHNFEDYSTDM